MAFNFDPYNFHVGIDHQAIDTNHLVAAVDRYDKESILTIVYDRSFDSLINVISALQHRQTMIILDHRLPDKDIQSLTQLLDLVNLDDFPETIFIATSGSSGSPKLCCIPIAAVITSAQRSLSNQPIHDGHLIITNLSPAHMGGLLAVTKAMITGAGLQITKTLTNPNQLPCHLIIVPQQIPKLVQLIRQEPSYGPLIQSILVGGDSTPPHQRQALYDLKMPVIYSYGLTESCGQVSASQPFINSDHSGWPLPGVDIKVIDQCLAIQTDSLITGTISTTGFTPIPMTDGYFLTADLASIDSDGAIHIKSRRDLSFNTGAELIEPQYIEDVIRSSNLVDAVIIVPAKHPTLGLAPVACIQTNHPLANLIEFSKSHLSLSMQPKHWIEIPDTFDTDSKSIRSDCRRYVDGLNLSTFDLK